MGAGTNPQGTRVMLEQTRVNDEVWLPRQVSFKFEARVALFKGFNLDGEQQYRDYKKFRTTSKIVGMGEVKTIRTYTGFSRSFSSSLD